MKYNIALMISGVAWAFLVAALSVGIPSATYIIAGIGTALVVGWAVRRALRKSKGWAWYLLPFVSISIASVVFGAFGESVAWISEKLSHGPIVDLGKMYLTCAYFLLYALTIYLPVTYPASLATHFLLRRFALPRQSV